MFERRVDDEVTLALLEEQHAPGAVPPHRREPRRTCAGGFPGWTRTRRAEHTAAFIQASLAPVRGPRRARLRDPRSAARWPAWSACIASTGRTAARASGTGSRRTHEGKGLVTRAVHRPARLRLRRARPQPRRDRLRARQHPELRDRGAARLRARGRAAPARVALRPLRGSRRVRDARVGVGHPSPPPISREDRSGPDRVQAMASSGPGSLADGDPIGARLFPVVQGQPVRFEQRADRPASATPRSARGWARRR